MMKSRAARLNQFNRRPGSLEVYRRRRGPGAELYDSAAADAWARKQEWWPRVVESGNTRNLWVWKCERP